MTHQRGRYMQRQLAPDPMQSWTEARGMLTFPKGFGRFPVGQPKNRLIWTFVSVLPFGG